MPEALVVVAVVVVTLIAWVGAWLHARNPANQNPHHETERLRHQALWLEARLDVALREKWTTDMISSLSDELGATTQQLAQASARAEKQRGAGCY